MKAAINYMRDSRRRFAATARLHGSLIQYERVVSTAQPSAHREAVKRLTVGLHYYPLNPTDSPVSLAPGVRVGPYKVTAKIGQGGMGEVYRARDTKLSRDVALKVLPQAFATDSERLARFKREAQVLASLNHPNIATIYGFEDGGAVQALVMELVEGPTLADRLGEGPLTLDEALTIARQLAEGLEAAHEQGIIHRDLKPANVKVRVDGAVKILDFGLAKALAPEGTSSTHVDIANTPTVTSPAGTAIGVILGTAAYMSPEQARGRPVDRRADIWAFGSVLFEMLAGRRAFDGEDASEVLAAVIKAEPPWEAIPENVPPAVRRLVRRCLEKDPRRRLRDVAEGMLQLDEALAVPAATVPVARRSFLQRNAAALVFVTVAAAALSSYGLFGSSRRAQDIVRISGRSGDFSLSANPRPHLTLMDDGRLIYRTSTGLSIKQPHEFHGVPIEGVGQATTPFVSPDGEWLGFVQGSPPDNLLFKVPLRGGPLTQIAESPERTYGADWGPDDTIVFGTMSGLFKIAAGSITPVPVTKGTGTVAGAHSWPSFAGSADLVLFSIGQEENARLAAVSMGTGVVTELGVSGTSPRYLPTGHIAYATSDGVLWTVAFNPGRIALTGVPVPLESGVRVRSASGSADFAVSNSGVLIYVAAEDDGRVPVWLDRKGAESVISADARPYVYPRLSNRGERLVLATGGRARDLWLWDFAKPGLRPLVRNLGSVRWGSAAWTADDKAIFFTSALESRPTLQRLNADGSGQPVRVMQASRPLTPHSVVNDGSSLIVRDGDDIALLNLANLGELVTLVPKASNPALSPDGRWLAYESTKSGEREVYVQPFPTLSEGEWQISRGYGSAPVWSRDGREIYYVSRNQMVAVPIDDRAGFSASPPHDLFDASAYPAFGLSRHFDVAKDGRFLMLKQIDSSEPEVRFVLNWFDEVNARVKPR
jgi:serine/threonine protein kinase